ncbi:MAG: hypothetical protein IKU56_00615 [Clostridia bacterium]|nr:hypothetical protein [Clostridia bacterium]
MRKFIRLFCIGGAAYNLIEILWRGHSHWSMFLVGGTCFHLIGKIGTRLQNHSVLLIGAACSATVTAVEYVSGCLFNLRLKLNVWDYSNMPANLKGQVCLLYSTLWGGLSLLVLPLYRRLNKKGKVT